MRREARAAPVRDFWGDPSKRRGAEKVGGDGIGSAICDGARGTSMSSPRRERGTCRLSRLASLDIGLSRCARSSDAPPPRCSSPRPRRRRAGQVRRLGARRRVREEPDVHAGALRGGVRAAVARRPAVGLGVVVVEGGRRNSDGRHRRRRRRRPRLKFLLFDVAFHEQLNKQRRALMFFLHLAMRLKRTLVLPRPRLLRRRAQARAARSSRRRRSTCGGASSST